MKLLFKAFFDIIGMFAAFSRKVHLLRLILVHYNMSFPMITFSPDRHYSATWLQLNFLAYWIPCRKFHEKQFLSEKFSLGPIEPEILEKNWIWVQERAKVHGAAQLRGRNFQRLSQSSTPTYVHEILLPPARPSKRRKVF